MATIGVNNTCNKCFKYHNKTTIKDCSLCIDLKFPENVLCDLTRSEQENELFKCYAYRPLLTLANQGISKRSEQKDVNDDSSTINISNRTKWFMTYAKQQMQFNPEQEFYSLKYHICLITRKREKIFSDPKRFVRNISDIFKNVESVFNDTKIDLLWLAEDHIHLYIDSNPDYSLDELAFKIMELSEIDIIEGFLQLKKIVYGGRAIFHKQ